MGSKGPQFFWPHIRHRFDDQAREASGICASKRNSSFFDRLDGRTNVICMELDCVTRAEAPVGYAPSMELVVALTVLGIERADR